MFPKMGGWMDGKEGRERKREREKERM